MNKLIKSEFLRLFKSNVFRFCLLFSAGLGIFMVLMRWSDIKMNPNIYAKLSAEYCNADGLIFTGAFYMIFAIAVLVSIFVGTEYSNGTIRNKIVVGHIRLNIYFSKLIVCAVADIIIHILCILAVLIFGELFIGGTTFSMTKILLLTLVSSSAILAMTALLLLLSMSIQSKASGAVVCLLTTFIMMFIAMAIYQRLSVPEYYDSYSYIDENTGEEIEVDVDKEKNPRYLTGEQRKIFEFLNNFIPVSQLNQIMMNSTENLKVIVIYDIIIIITTTGAGMYLFKRKNLN